MRTIDNEIMRAPTEHEKELIEKIKAERVGNALIGLIYAIICLVGSIVAPIILVQKNIVELNAMSVVTCGMIVFLFAACAICMIMDHNSATRECKKDDDGEWFAVNGIAEGVAIGKENCIITGTIGKEKKRRVVFEIGPKDAEKLFKDRTFALFVNNDEVCSAVGISGEVAIANGVVVGEELEDYEND